MTDEQLVSDNSTTIYIVGNKKSDKWIILPPFTSAQIQDKLMSRWYDFEIVKMEIHGEHESKIYKTSSEKAFANRLEKHPGCCYGVLEVWYLPIDSQE